MRALPFWLASTFAFAAGCGGSAFTAGQEGGTDEASSPDAAAISTEGGVDAGEAGAEASTPDGGGADAGHWCMTDPSAQKATFCADFDEYTSIGAVENAWTSYSLLGGSFSLDTSATGPSPPNALQFATSSTSNVQALLVEALPALATPPASIRLDFQLRIDDASGIGTLASAPFAAILLGDSAHGPVVALQLAAGPKLGAVWSEGADAGLSGFGGAPFTSSFPTEGAWAGRFALEIQYTSADGGRAGCVQAYTNGTTPELATCLSLPPSMLNPTHLSIALGVFSSGSGNTGTIGLHFDNVIANVL
jgi:hypothetical protein